MGDVEKITRNARHPGIALVLQGGGARAAYQAGVLKAISEILGHPEENPFPIITGTSAGAINAAVLAVNADNFARGVKTLLEVWENFSPDKVYRTLVPRNVRLAEAPSYGAPAVVWDKTSKGALAYVALTEEILKGRP